ncbi:MAG: LysM peptidoglycan-binding domain-containing protein [Phycisphaerae bacterium]|nr:LysM peptidoglycan-binding domain-containing protein [Phycisphaerae bacterium]
MGTGHRFLLVGVFIAIVVVVLWVAVSTSRSPGTNELPFEPSKTAANANSANSNSRGVRRVEEPRRTPTPTPSSATPNSLTSGTPTTQRPLPPVANSGTAAPTTTPTATPQPQPQTPPAVTQAPTGPSLTPTETREPAPPPQSPSLQPQGSSLTAPPVATAQLPRPATPSPTPDPRTAAPLGVRPEPSVPPPPRGDTTARDDGVSRLLGQGNAAGKPASTYVVKAGDSLAAIARELYGDDRYWKALAEANPGVDPARLFVGKALVVPAKEVVLAGKAAAAATTAKPPNGKKNGNANGNANGSDRTAVVPPPKSAKPDSTPAKPVASGDVPKARRATYRVAANDSLVSIAREVLNDGDRWREIWELNKDRLKSPDAVPVGFELKLPESGSDSGASGNANGGRAPTSRSGRARG